jgi:hypothetical protein
MCRANYKSYSFNDLNGTLVSRVNPINFIFVLRSLNHINFNVFFGQSQNIFLYSKHRDICRGNKTLTVVLFLSQVMMWHTHTLQAVPWMGRAWASNRVKSVSLSSTWLQDILYASCFSLFKAIKDIESFELFIFISLES